MRRDVLELRAFYGSARGRAAREMLTRKVVEAWGDAAGLDVLGLGYATPLLDPLRQRARRVVAAMPAAQEAGDASGESDRVHWMRPAEALERWAAGDLAMMTPTSDTLRTLLPFSTAAEVLQAADERTIVPLMPQPSLDASGALRWMLIDASTGESLLELGPEDV